MRILVANKYHRMVGGVEAHVAAVTAWLEAAGHEVIPFAMAEEDSMPTPSAKYFPSEVDFRVSSVRGGLRTLERATLSRETRRLLGELLDAERIDAAYVVHVYHQLGTVILDDLAARGIPTVLSLHDYKIACPNYRFFSERTGKICTRCLDDKAGFAYAPIVERCWAGSTPAGVALSLEAIATRARGSYRKAGAVTVLNGLQERAAAAAGVSAARIRRLPHPVELGSERPVAERDHVLYVGRLVPEKGVDVLIRAAATSRVPVVIVGGGRDEDALRALADELEAPVTFAGAVAPDEVAGYLADAAALVVPSVWHEVSPLVVYEAMSADVPVIGTNVGGITEQLGEDRGLLVAAGDVDELAAALQTVVGDQAHGRILSANARAYAAEHLSPAQWERNMTAAFHSAGATDFST